MRAHASNTKNSDLEYEDYPLRASGMRDFEHSVKQNLEETIIKHENPGEEIITKCLDNGLILQN